MPEAELQWIKSSASTGNLACVELALDDGDILLRSSRRPEQHIRFTRAEIAAFLAGAQKNEFDHLVAGA